MPTFEDSRALHDPVGVESEPLVEVLVRDHRIGHVAAGGEDADALEATAAWSRRWGTFIVHECQTDLLNASSEGVASTSKRQYTMPHPDWLFEIAPLTLFTTPVNLTRQRNWAKAYSTTPSRY